LSVWLACFGFSSVPLDSILHATALKSPFSIPTPSFHPPSNLKPPTTTPNPQLPPKKPKSQKKRKEKKRKEKKRKEKKNTTHLQLFLVLTRHLHNILHILSETQLFQGLRDMLTRNRLFALLFRYLVCLARDERDELDAAFD
jgi:hypothetical protein